MITLDELDTPLKNTPFVSLIIPLFNEEEQVSFCIESALQLNYPEERIEIIIVDNGSTDNSCIIAKKYPIKLLLKPDVKVGAVRNFGVAKSSGEIIVFLDADCTVKEDWLIKGVRSLQEQDCDAVGGLVRLRDNPTWVERYWLLRHDGYLYQNTLIGACIFIRRNVFLSINGFDENLSAGEDSDLSSRLKNAGYQIKLDAELSVAHLGFPTTATNFIRRQTWHASDYAYRLKSILSDKIFLLVVLFISGLLMSPSIFFDFVPVQNKILAIVFVFLPPLILTIKRLYRFKIMVWNPVRLLIIYVIDLFYILGRCIGFINGLYSRFILGVRLKSFK